MLSASVVCLALAMYHEARSESLIGQVAVGKIILNRSASGDRRWPVSICDVVHQGGIYPHKCQFSFYCDGKGDKPHDIIAWGTSLRIAVAMLDGRLYVKGLDYATCYHNTSIKAPPWAKGQFTQIKGHIFYAC